MRTRPMPFGAHQGVPLEDVPDDYLRWLAAREWLREPLRSQVEDELERRAGRDSKCGTQPPGRLYLDPEQRELATELVRVGYRRLATKLHPDAGGDHIAMQRLGYVRELLHELLLEADD